MFENLCCIVDDLEVLVEKEKCEREVVGLNKTADLSGRKVMIKSLTRFLWSVRSECESRNY